MESLFKIEPLEDFLVECVLLLENLFISQTQSAMLQQSVFEEAQAEIKLIILKSDYNLSTVSENLKLKSLDPEKLMKFLEILEKKRIFILYQALVQTNCHLGETVLNFDWAVKLVLGTSDLKTLQVPCLQLKLATIGIDGTHNKRCYETNNLIIGKAINVLESLI